MQITQHHINSKTVYQKQRTEGGMLHLKPTDFDTWKPLALCRQKSFPPDATPRLPTPASQYLSENATIQWLVPPSLLQSATISYGDCRVRMHSTCKESYSLASEREPERVYEKDNLIKRANGNLSHKNPRSQTGSLRVEGSEGGGTYN
jgi:hypothetical protein